MQNAYGLTWSNQYRNGAGQQVAPTLRAMQLRADGTGPHMLLAAGSHTALILSPQGHQLDLLSLPVSTYKLLALSLSGLSFSFCLSPLASLPDLPACPNCLTVNHLPCNTFCSLLVCDGLVLHTSRHGLLLTQQISSNSWQLGRWVDAQGSLADVVVSCRHHQLFPCKQ